MRQMGALVDPTAIGRATVLGLTALLALTLVAAYPTPSHAQRIPSRNLSIRYYGVSNIGEPAIDRPDVGAVAGLVVDHDSLSLIGPISNAGFLRPDPGAKAACNPGANVSLARLPAAVKNDPGSSAIVSAFDAATHPTIALPDTATDSAPFSQHFGFTYPDPYTVGTGPDSPHTVFIQSDVEITPLGDSIFDNQNGP